MHERKAEMAREAEGFIALPGKFTVQDRSIYVPEIFVNSIY